MKNAFVAVGASLAAAGVALAPTSAVAAPAYEVPVERVLFIDHVQTGEHLTPNGFAATPTSYVDIYDDFNGVDTKTEKWVYESVNTNTFRIRNAGGNVCLQPASVEYRKIVSTKTCSATNQQQWWKLYDTTTGVKDGFTLRPAIDTSLAITPNGVPSGNDQYVVLSPVGDYDNQVFRNRIA